MKIKKQKNIYIAWSVIVLLFILSISSYEMIPFGDPDGLDFHNIYAYSTCDKELASKFNNNIYLAGGIDCGDAMGREFVYPPLLFFSAKWVGNFKTFEDARLAWRIFIVLGTFLCLISWLGWKKETAKALPFIILLFFQFPMLFALERGNNDILVLTTWTLSYILYRERMLFWSGFFAAICVLMKVYPLFAFIIIFFGMLGAAFAPFSVQRDSDAKISFLRYFLGATISGILILFIFRDLWYSWYLRVSHFSDFKMIVSYLNHSVQYFSSGKILGKLIYLIMMSVWFLHFLYSKKDKRVVTFAGVLAISTYYSAVSYDYNQITVYPLILLNVAFLISRFEWKRYVILLGLLFGVIAHREIFMWGGNLGFKFHMFLQVLFISLVAVIDLPFWKLKQYFKFKKMKRELLWNNTKHK